MLSLRWKLGGALLLVVLVSVGLMAYLTNRDTTAQFQQYIQGGYTVYRQKLLDTLAQYYTENRGWNGVEDILQASLRNNNERLVLADNSGRILADTAGQLTGEQSGNLETGNAFPIQVSGQPAGALYLFLTGGMGRGYMGGRGYSSNTSPVHETVIQNPESSFLDRINNYLWIAGIIAVVVAFLLGIFLTRQIIRPLHGLSAGAKHIAEGDLSYRVKVNSRDEIGKLAESFNNMAMKLDNSEQARKRLVSDVAHEIRTPLTIIQGTVDGIEDGIFSADKEHLDSIREQTVMLTHLISDLRDLSMAESGQLKLELSETDITELVRRKLNQFEVNTRLKSIRMIFEVLSPVRIIRIDAKRIEQVLSNLLSNAIRHTPPGGQISLTLKVEGPAQKNGREWLILSVADTGEGIAAEHLPHIFDRFYRVEDSRSRGEGGAGLGLAIVKQMVQAHGGEVKVESRPGHGSTFYLYLPYTQMPVT